MATKRKTAKRSKSAKRSPSLKALARRAVSIATNERNTAKQRVAAFAVGVQLSDPGQIVFFRLDLHTFCHFERQPGRRRWAHAVMWRVGDQRTEKQGTFTLPDHFYQSG